MVSTDDNLAESVARLSVQYIIERNRDKWLSLFDHSASIINAQGKSLLGTFSHNEAGQEVLDRFYNTLVDFRQVNNMTINLVIPAGNSCAVHLDVEYVADSGKLEKMSVIVNYLLSKKGLIEQMKVYWNFKKLMDNIANTAG